MADSNQASNTWDTGFHFDSDDDVRNPRYHIPQPKPAATPEEHIQKEDTSPPAQDNQPICRPDPTSHTPPPGSIYHRPPVPDHTKTDRLPVIRPPVPADLPHLKHFLVICQDNMPHVEEFDPGHQDRVTVLHINYDGTRILTASVDHRVKVWNRDPKTGEKTLVETFTAHDADIRDAKWLHPTTGSHIVTIGNDLRCRVWAEDFHRAPNSGQRFKRIAQIHCPVKGTPFVSLDIKTVDSVFPYLALIDRQGLLQIYEPSSPDELHKEWNLIDKWQVTIPAPGRGEETSFRVRFDPNDLPLPYINSLSEDKKMLSLVVTAMNQVKIYRSVISDSNGDSNGSRRFTFWEAAQLEMHPNLVRDVQWAPFNSRGHDLIATACKDGSVRIYEMEITANSVVKNTNGGEHARKQSQSARSQPQSSLTTAIVGRKAASQDQTMNSINPSAAGPNKASTSRQGYNFPFKHEIALAAKLDLAHNDAWAVSWDPSGAALMSGGADGVTKIWKKSIASEEWKLFADQAVEIGDGSEDEDGEVEG